MPDPGKLRHRVEIQFDKNADGQTTSTVGEQPEDWKTEATRWAAINDQGGRELWQAQQVNPAITCMVELRWYPGLTSHHRFKHRDRILNIDHIGEGDRRNDWMTVMCVEKR